MPQALQMPELIERRRQEYLNDVAIKGFLKRISEVLTLATPIMILNLNSPISQLDIKIDGDSEKYIAFLMGHLKIYINATYPDMVREGFIDLHQIELKYK